MGDQKVSNCDNMLEAPGFTQEETYNKASSVRDASLREKLTSTAIVNSSMQQDEGNPRATWDADNSLADKVAGCPIQHMRTRSALMITGIV